MFFTSSSQNLSCISIRKFLLDPDVALVCSEQNKELNHIDFYADVLDRHPEVDVVGPNLRVNDIPDMYPIKEKVLSRDEHIWNQDLRFEFQGIQLTNYTIDTTFGMYRRGYELSRPRIGFRVKEVNPENIVSRFAELGELRVRSVRARSARLSLLITPEFDREA